MLLLRSRPSPTVAVDLGTAFVRVASSDGPLFERSTTVPGAGAGRSAMVRGVVNDVELAGALLRAAFDEAGVSPGRTTSLVISLPATATPVERSGLLWAVRAAGVRREPVLVEEPLAAAIGLGIDVASPEPRLVLDVGHGITEAAVIAGGSIQSVAGVRVGCGALSAAIDELEAQRAATRRGVQFIDPARRQSENRRAVQPILDAIAETAFDALAALDVDMAAAIDAIDLVGGGSLVPSIVSSIRQRVGLDVRLAPGRFHAVTIGDAACAEMRSGIVLHEQRRRRSARPY